MAYRFERGSTTIAAATTLITTPITAMAASTTTAIRLGPTGQAHLLHARLKAPDKSLMCTLSEVSPNPKEVT
jgi:hypothetical protein